MSDGANSWETRYQIRKRVGYLETFKKNCRVKEWNLCLPFARFRTASSAEFAASLGNIGHSSLLGLSFPYKYSCFSSICQILSLATVMFFSLLRFLYELCCGQVDCCGINSLHPDRTVFRVSFSIGEILILGICLNHGIHGQAAIRRAQPGKQTVS